MTRTCRNIVPIIIHCTHYLSSHYFARTLQLILEISATYRFNSQLSASRFVTNLQVADTQCMISKSNVNLFSM